MDKNEFWRFIDISKIQEDQAEWLTGQLIQLDEKDILDFEFHFEDAMNQCYQSRIWGAAFVLMGGCSDDTFDYFRGWLIGQGEETFHKVLEQPEYLACYITGDTLDEEGFPQNEELLNAGLDAYTFKKTGNMEWNDEVHDQLLDEMEKLGLEPPSEIEFDWEEDDLEDMFPELWKRFGEDPLG